MNLCLTMSAFPVCIEAGAGMPTNLTACIRHPPPFESAIPPIQEVSTSHGIGQIMEFQWTLHKYEAPIRSNKRFLNPFLVNITY